MAHWKLTLSYDGTGFHGWQVQPGLVTVQGTLAAAVEHVTGERVLPQGSGRTDAGVHALGQVASFALVAEIPAENLQRALNRALPASVRVLAAQRVPEGFHARHSATGKRYEYRVFCPMEMGAVCSPFVAPYAWECRWRVEVARMQEAAKALVGEHDFASFAASDPDRAARESEAERSTVRTIFSFGCEREGDMVVLRVHGSGFLHHMVRNIVGTLVEVGRGALQVEDMERVLEARDRRAAGPTAPAKGLFLVAVEYAREYGEVGV